MIRTTTRHLRILGIRGIPAQHGGFETFAQECAPYMQRRGYQVTVYCQEEGTGPMYEDSWREVRRVHIPVKGSGPISTMVFDWKAIRHAAGEQGVVLCLGYNTALFNLRLFLRRYPILINMDGIEWKRDKWSLGAKVWLYLNELAGIFFSHHLIADNPGIAVHLRTRSKRSPTTTIPYGAHRLTSLSAEPLEPFGLHSGDYVLLIARPEPENSILEIVQAFSATKGPWKLAVLGNYNETNPYHRSVLQAACDRVVFLGAIYDQEKVATLRYHCRFYVHGHTVGGTNPSLVEAMGAGNAILAHDNIFNRWVTGQDAALFFKDSLQCRQRMEMLLAEPDILVKMKEASRLRFLATFTWDMILAEYEKCIASFIE